ncbi:hypothetical protein K1719_019100 [Acacia pycnantha]|nr:hypothetical protein K1719_019100 [Acacia pycnantha]
MCSSKVNRHWPSMFKSKPASCNSLHHHQWNKHHSIISPSSCHKTSSKFTFGYLVGSEEERYAEPNPRWNPKPEQIRILEAIFNSGMVNPPRDEIRKIIAQIQGYGQVVDANVFYWFQDSKSKSKHKLRHLHNSSNNTSHQTQNLNNNFSPKEITTPPPQPNKPLLMSITSCTPPPPPGADPEIY